MSIHQQRLSFIKSKGCGFIKRAGKGLIKPSSSLTSRFKKMSLGSGVSRKHIEELGGTIKQHQRPFQLNNTTPKQKETPKYKPIHFKL